MNEYLDKCLAFNQIYPSMRENLNGLDNRFQKKTGNRVFAGLILSFEIEWRTICYGHWVNI
ncbi:MAG: hypothetical protein Pars2KO_21550 [Parasphingorhabdus sp.]